MPGLLRASYRNHPTLRALLTAAVTVYGHSKGQTHAALRKARCIRNFRDPTVGTLLATLSVVWLADRLPPRTTGVLRVVLRG
jgi:hypothetical protein